METLPKTLLETEANPVVAPNDGVAEGLESFPCPSTATSFVERCTETCRRIVRRITHRRNIEITDDIEDDEPVVRYMPPLVETEEYEPLIAIVDHVPEAYRDYEQLLNVDDIVPPPPPFENFERHQGDVVEVPDLFQRVRPQRITNPFLEGYIPPERYDVMHEMDVFHEAVQDLDEDAGDEIEEWFEAQEHLLEELEQINERRRITDVLDVIADAEEVSTWRRKLTAIKQSICDSDFMENLPLPDLDTIYTWLADLKPVNLMCFYHDIINSNSIQERFAITIRLCEMYNLFWTPELKMLDVIIVQAIVSLIHILFGVENEEVGVTQAMFTANGEQTFMTELLHKFGITINIPFEDTAVKILGAVLGIFLLITGGKACNFSLSADNIIKRMKKISTVVKSIRSLTTDLPEVAAALLNEVANLFGYSYETEADAEVRQFREELLKFKIEVFDMHHILKTKPAAILLDGARILKINNVMKNMDDLYDKLLKQKANSACCKPLLDDIRPVVNSINEFVVNSREESCTKIEPFMCVLTGAAGIGKSQLVNALSRDVTRRIHDKYPEFAQIKPSMYMRNSSDKYWSGYAGETFVGYDDFGQVKTDTDHADIMMIKNPNRSILNMAALQDKGRCFTSLGIFACANQVSVSSSAVVKSLAALGRRFEIHVYCHDPNFEQFKAEHGCSPGNFEKKNRMKAEVNDTAGNKIPYFDPVNFTHLSLFECPGDTPRTAENTTKITFAELGERCFNFFDHYYEMYRDSQIVAVPHQLQEQYSRATSSVNEVVANADAEIAKELAQRITRDKQIKQQVEFFVKDQRGRDDRKYNLPKEPGQFLPDLKTVKIFTNSQRQETNENPFVEQDQDLPSFEWPGARPKTGRQQAKTEVDSSATAFFQYEQKRGITYLLAGDPGAGKSTLAKKVAAQVGSAFCTTVSGYDLHRVTVTTPCLYIEDATVTKEAWLRTEELIMKQEDGHNPFQVLIVTINPRCLFEWLDEKSDSWKRVLRRCDYYSFNWSIKERGFFRNSYYSDVDLRSGGVPFAKAVDLTNIHGEIIGYDALMEKMVTDIKSINAAAFAQVICSSVPYIASSEYTPNFIVEFSSPMYSAFKILYDDPKKMLSMIFRGEVKMLKGNAMEGYRIAQQFQSSSSSKPAFPESLEKFIVMINNSAFTSEIDFITEIRCIDKTVVIMPKKQQPKQIACFLVCERLEISETSFTDGENSAVPNLVTSRVYADYLSNASTIAERLNEQTEAIQERATNAIGHTFANKNVWFNRLLKIAVFCAKVGMAYVAVKSYAAKFNLPMEQERSKAKRAAAKKANKRRKAFKADLGKHEYDELKEAFDEFANTAARERGMRKVYNDFGADPFEEDGQVNDEFVEFVMTYESMEKLKAKETPKLDVVEDPFQVEKGPPPIPPRLPSKQHQQLAEVGKAMLENDIIKHQSNIWVQESTLDPALRTILQLARKHHVSLGTITAGTWEHSVHGLMVGGRYGITVLHAVGQPILAQILVEGKQKSFDIKVVKRFPKNDLAIFEIEDKTCPQFKSIVQHFPTKSFDFKKKLHNTQAVLLTVEEDNNLSLVRSVRVQTPTMIACTDPYGMNLKEYELLPYTGFVTGINMETAVLTVAGDCGSPLIANNTLVTNKILGIHSAAVQTKGASAMLCQEIFADLPGLNFKSQAQVSKQSVTPPLHDIEYVKETNKMLLGMPVVAELEQTKHMPVKTKLWTSPIALPEANEYEPSILSERDHRNLSSKHPYYESIKKWNNPEVVVDEEQLVDIYEGIGDYYATKIYKAEETVKKLTKTEAINSGKDISVTQLNRDASPGFPWCNLESKVRNFLVDKGTGGNAYYGFNYEKESARILNHSVDTLINIAKQPNKFPTIAFMGTLKDEPLKLKKIYSCDPGDEDSIHEMYPGLWQGSYAPNTRSFAGSPLDYTIASRMYYGAGIGAINSVRSTSPIQIGIDAGGLEWHWMISDLLSCSTIGLDTDFKGWDGSVPYQFKKHLHIVYNRIYQLNDPEWTLEDDIVRENLMYAEVRPNIVVIMPDNTIKIVQAPGGEPSGSPRTATDNSLMHLAMHIYCVFNILKRAGNPELCTVSNVIRMVKPKIYGDDGMVAVHPSLLDIIKFSTLSAEYAKLGMKCTPAAKNDKLIEFQSILQLEFLKRKTVLIGKYYYGALLKTSMQKMLAYCKGPAHHWYRDRGQIRFYPEDIVATACSALHEAILHGKAYYLYLYNHFLKKFREFGIDGEIPTYKEQLIGRTLPISQ